MLTWFSGIHLLTYQALFYIDIVLKNLKYVHLSEQYFVSNTILSPVSRILSST